MSDTPTSDTEESPINQPSPNSMLSNLFQSTGMVDMGQTTLDFVDTRRAFRQSYACETADGSAMIGAVRVTPGRMGMKDDISKEVRQLAAALTAWGKGSGMLVDVPREVQTQTQKERMLDLVEQFDGDDASWEEQIQADLAEEEAAVENVYQETTTKHEHLIVLRVDKADAATSLSSSGVFEDMWGVGKLVGWRNKRDLVESDRLHRQMEQTLATRLSRLARRVSKIEGVEASPVSSTILSEALAQYYRTDDPARREGFRSLIRGSPLPDSHSSTYTTNIEHPEVELEDQSVDPISATDPEDRCRSYQAVLAPKSDVSMEQDGSFSVGDREIASIVLTSLPGNPSNGYLEPVYRYDNPNVDVTIATQFNRKDDGKAQRDANDAKNSLKEKQKLPIGGSYTDDLPKMVSDAKSFANGLKTSDMGVFEVVIVITLSAESTVDEDGNVVPASAVLEEAVDDMIETELGEKCGLDAKLLDGAHQDGWRTCAPAATNHLQYNAEMRADGLASQMPYQYKTLNERNGIRIGLHEYLKTPCYMQVFGSERGNGQNMGIYGMIGSGKTTTVQDIAKKVYLKHQHPSVDEDLKMIISTPLRDLEAPARAMGGEKIVVGGGTPINPQSIRYVPVEKLRAVDDVDRPWKDMLERLDAFLASYYQIQGKTDYSDKKDVWMRAAKHAQKQAGIDPSDPETFAKEPAPFQDTIDCVMEMRTDPEKFVSEKVAEDQQTLDDKASLARSIVTQDIEPFSDDGQFNHFTEKSEVNIGDAEVIFLDFQNYDDDDGMAGLEMQMRLADLYEQGKSFDGRVFFGVDEFATMLKNPKSEQFFAQTHRRSRHWDMCVCLATQEISDLFRRNEDGEIKKTDSAQVMFNNQAIQFYHYLKGMDDKWGQDLNLSMRSQDFSATATTGDAKKGYANALCVVDGEEYPLRIEMSNDLNPRSFSLYQHDPTDDPDLKEYLENYGDNEQVCNWRWS